MPLDVTIRFASLDLPEGGTLVLLRDKEGDVRGEAARAVVERIDHAARAARWEGGFGETLDLWAADGFDRVVVLGLGERDKLGDRSWLKLGGKLGGAVGKAPSVHVLLSDATAAQAAEVAAGAMLKLDKFDRYKSERKDIAHEIVLHVADPDIAETAWEAERAVAQGTLLARDLVNEPANVLTPKRFAKRAAKVEKLGCTVSVLKEGDMEELGMRALLGVAQGSRNAPRMVLMEWRGGEEGAAPVAFVGKGVTFDTGGISIKPAGGMEDMKGDMGGAATVAGLMHALATRKAKVNAVGCIALVENMPDGNAQRPGDIVEAMSGKTIEIINTDAEGRLVLADALHHVQERYRPRFVVDLATLTGAVIVALGHIRAGMYANDDRLAKLLADAGDATGEPVWRMPLGPEYDKLIDSKNADMKNTGGRSAGSITAAQFLQRFVQKDQAWAHLDIAGTAFGAPETEVGSGWASGFGVRLLDRVVRDGYEAR